MLTVTNLTFKYAEPEVLNRINLKIKPGENLAIIGESGSGKSTLLKLLYGEYDLHIGHVFWKNTEILGPKHNLIPGYDFMKYVAQEFDLMPYTTVEENIGKHLSNFHLEQKKTRIAELIKLLDLVAVKKTKVKLLSGGQKQRVALARALAETPEIILLDEPFSHIDNFQKQALRRRVFKYLKKNNITTLVATHDRDDVLGFADTMVILNNTKIIANKTPQELYKNPIKPLVAAFFGEFNIIDGNIVYTHQIRVVSKSDKQVVIKRNSFKGAYYLVEAVFNNEIIFFEHHEMLPKKETVFIEITK